MLKRFVFNIAIFDTINFSQPKELFTLFRTQWKLFLLLNFWFHCVVEWWTTQCLHCLRDFFYESLCEASERVWEWKRGKRKSSIRTIEQLMSEWTEQKSFHHEKFLSRIDKRVIPSGKGDAFIIMKWQPFIKTKIALLKEHGKGECKQVILPAIFDLWVEGGEVSSNEVF